jgi:hypothetical protein
VTYFDDTQEIEPRSGNRSDPETEISTALKDENRSLQIALERANRKIEKRERAVPILGAPLDEAEKTIQDHDQAQYGAVMALRADFNGTDAQVRTITTCWDDTITALTKVVNTFITTRGTTQARFKLYAKLIFCLPQSPHYTSDLICLNMI